jgi:hypothetical protein
MTAEAATSSRFSQDERALRARLDGLPKLDLVEHWRAALAHGSEREATMIAEIEELRRGPGRLTAEEYFYFRLDDPSLQLADKRRFVGKRAQASMHAQCNDPAWQAAAHDKVLFHERMSDLGFPIPRLVATHHAPRSLDGTPNTTSAAALADVLRSRIPYPCFAKPIDGMYSLGAYLIEAHDHARDELVLAGGSRTIIEAFAQSIDGADYVGYLFQERLRPNPLLAAVIGDRLATLRLVILLGGKEPELFRVLLKVPVGSHIADNFWRAGNMLAAVDQTSGKICRVVSGVGKDQRHLTHHPDTGQPLLGTMVPAWQDAMALGLAAARALPGIRTQSWDIAIAAEGPVLVEVNFGGDFNLPQIAFGTGMLDDRFRAHLAACEAMPHGL